MNSGDIVLIASAAVVILGGALIGVEWLTDHTRGARRALRWLDSIFFRYEDIEPAKRRTKPRMISYMPGEWDRK